MKTNTTMPTFPVGALELIVECQQLLAGERRSLTTVEQYKEQRRRYWQMQALRPRRAPKPARDVRAA